MHIKSFSCPANSDGMGFDQRGSEYLHLIGIERPLGKTTTLELGLGHLAGFTLVGLLMGGVETKTKQKDDKYVKHLIWNGEVARVKYY